jgi:LEA14-like dessication related protein
VILSSATIQAEDTKEPYLVKTKDFHVNNFSLSEINLGITAVIYNPYKVKVKVEEILIDVFIGDKKLGTITEADKVKIPKESAFDLPLTINVKTGPTLSKFITEGTKLVLGQKIKVDYKGYVKVRALGFIPVKVKINQTAYFTMKDILKSDDKPAADSISKKTTPEKSIMKEDSTKTNKQKK